MPHVPVYAPHVRIIASGVMGPVGSAWEIFSYSFALSSPGPGEDITPANFDDVFDDVQAYHARPGTMIHPRARLTSLKAALIDPDGSWVGATPRRERAVNVAGGGQGPANIEFLSHPPQVALAVTLRSALNTPRGRGRFYLPLPCVSVSSATGLIETSEAQGVVTSTVTLANALNNQPGFDGSDTGLSVASGYTANRLVTSISVGRVADTIRSRRNAIREAYLSGAVA